MYHVGMGFFDMATNAAASAVAENRPAGSRRGLDRNHVPPFAQVVPAVLPWSRRLGGGENVRVALGAVYCWHEALGLDIWLFFQNQSGDLAQYLPFPHARPNTVEGIERLPRVGIEFADGRTATNLDYLATSSTEPDAGNPVLFPGTGGGGGGGTEGYSYMRQHLYLWPVPIDGDISLIVDWPHRRMAESRTVLNGDEIRSAAAAAIDVWS
jgi:hypothetical protein